jgi:hypothetical protein
MEHRPHGGARRALAFLLVGLASACGDRQPDPPATPSGSGESESVEGGESPTYEQAFVFASLSQDSVFLVPWLMRTTVLPDTVLREAHGWLDRGGVWDAFYSASWATPPTRAPARILPYGSLRLLVQEGDVIDGIIFEEGARRLEINLGDLRASWGGPRGEAIELLDGAAYLSDERLEGLVLHTARASSGAAPPGGDWAILAAGDSMVLVLQTDEEHGGEDEPVYRGWARLGEEERVWTEVGVEWTATQAFPPARRDIPVSWRLTTEERQLQGNLESRSAHIQEGVGPGPLLPVRAVYDVAGQIALEGRAYTVRGLFVHERR